MTFVDTPLPASLELVPLREPTPRERRLANLRHDGRLKGVKNKICRDLKEGLLEGAILHGFDGEGEGGLIGFCLHLAKRHPKAYCGLLGKILPYNVNAAVSGGSRIGSINIVSVPSGSYLSSEAIEKMRSPGLVFNQSAPSEQIEPPKSEPEPEFVPQTERERQLLDRLEALSPEQLQEVARQAGYVDSD